MKVAFATLGCRVNMYESEAMAEKFIKEGYKVVPFEEHAEVYVINTCTVTNMGDKKSRQMINRAKRVNPESIIAVVGCYSQISPEAVSNIEGVNVVLGTRNKGDIVYYVNMARETGENVVKVGDVLHNKIFEDIRIEDYQYKARAFLKIQDGCNRFCSYCLIPYARGAACSKKPENVIKEVKELSKNGFKEIILSGINISSYGDELDEKITLLDIIEQMDEISGVERIRIGSIDPTFFTSDTIDRMSKLKKLCPHFHLSLQSGCDETLKRMNRHYTTNEFINIVQELRDKIKDVSITTDMIVGFPGETKEEFEITYEFLSNIKLCKTHIFKYSPREGTKAAAMKEQVHGDIKEERSNRLIKLNKKNEKEFMEKFIGRDLKVLYEQKVKGESNMYEGYTPNYIRVLSKCFKDIEGQIMVTKLLEVQDESVLGEMK